MAGKSVVTSATPDGSVLVTDESLTTRAEVAMALVTIAGKANSVGVSALARHYHRADRAPRTALGGLPATLGD